MRLFFCVLCLSTTCLGASAARAQTSSEWIIARMGGALRPEVTWEQVRSTMLMAFYQSNPDERGVTPQGIDNLRRSVMAQRRAQAIAQILNYDLDGDGSVSKDEITAVMQPRARQMIHVNGVQLEPTPQQVRLQLDKLISDALKPDTDGDGIITPAEIQEDGERHAQQAGAGWQQNAAQFVPMTLDSDGDGVVSMAEYEAAVREQFNHVDKDRDGRISASEFSEFGNRLNEARQAAQRAREAQIRKQRLQTAVRGCDVPTVPAGPRLLLLGAHDAKALSNAWIGNQDKLTYVTTVEVAPGRDPLYLALASNSAMIWDIVGATERIAGVIAHSETTLENTSDRAERQRVAGINPPEPQPGGKPLVGVMGVPREKVHFTAHKGCLVPASETTMKDGSAQESAALLLGRAADDIGGEHSPTSFRVPPAMHFRDQRVRKAIHLPADGLGDLIWREVQEEYPAGIARIDVDAVISAHPVKGYSVLPGRAGIAELVDAGALIIAGMSRGFRINGTDFKPYTSPDKFRVTGKIRIPAGAVGTFILPRDMPVPEGDLSLVCLVSATDMKPVDGQGRGRC
jgi:Ca2+-binding EF-hand superfamily protein